VVGVMDDQAQRDRRRSLTSDSRREYSIVRLLSIVRDESVSEKALRVVRIDDGGWWQVAMAGLNFRG
jgi:hypothetical protein